MNLKSIYNKWLSDQNDARKEEQLKLFVYYYNKSADKSVLNYLETALNLTFNPDDIVEFQKNWINITKKIVNQLSVVYKNPAARQVMKDAKIDQKLTSYYNNILFAVNTSDKQAHRFAKLANTSITRICFESGKIKYKILPTYTYDIETDDNGNTIALSYKAYMQNAKGEDELYTIVWTDEEHFRIPHLSVGDINTYGDPQKLPDMKDMLNPYKVIPYSVLSMEEQGDFWGTGMIDIINLNEQINVMLTDLISEQVLMGGAGTVFAVNCNLKPKLVDGEIVKSKLRIGRKHPLNVEDVKIDMKDPKLSYVATNPFIKELLDAIDWHIKMAALSKGLNPNAFLQEVKATSGFSKVLDSIEQLETRMDDIEPCRIYEDDRFKKTIAVNNYHASTTDGSKYNLQKIDEKATLRVDFAEIEMPKTQQEQENLDTFNLDNNLTNVVKIAQRDNPDLDDDETKEKLDQNKIINDKYRPKQIAPVAESQPNNSILGKGDNGSNHFRQGDSSSCGECAVRSILSMYGLELKTTLDTTNGLSPESIIQALEDNGITAEQNDNAVYNDIKPKSVVYYPGQDHYSVIESVNANGLVVNDSLKDKTMNMTKKDFLKDWNGFLITTNKI